MLELGLIDGLAAKLEALFDGYTLLNKAKVLQQVRIFKQYIPQAVGLAFDDKDKSGMKGYAESDYEANFPCIVVKYIDHTDKEERRLDQSTTNMKLLFGIYDEDYMCQGYRDILNMMERVRDDLLVHRIVSGIYMLEMPLKTRLLEVDTWPIYFGEMDLVFSTGRVVMGKDYVYKTAQGDVI